MKRHAKIDVAALLERVKAEGPDAVISRAEAAALIASRTMDDHDVLSVARNRVGMQLDRAAALGRAGHDIFSGGILPLPDGNYTADELGRWANRKYDNKFSNMPRNPRVCSTTCGENIGMSGRTDATVLPGDVPRAHAMILRLLAERSLAEANRLRAVEEHKRALVARFNHDKR